MERRLNEVEWSHTTNSGTGGSNSSNGTGGGTTGTSTGCSVNTSVTSGGDSGGGGVRVCADLFPTNDIDEDEDDQLTLVEKDRIIRSLETEVEAQVE